MTPRYLDGIIRIKNANTVGLPTVVLTHSKLTEEVLRVLKEAGRIVDFSSESKGSKKIINVTLKYQNGLPAVSAVKLYSKPGRRIYVGAGDLKRVKGGHGMAIVSTSKGLLNEVSAIKAKLGGELLFALW